MHLTIEAVLAGLFGLLLGSFLNVCIYRWPRDLSVAWPGSHCPNCRHAIAGYDNVPLLSYLILGGRCRHCLCSIHWRYPLVEALTGALFAAGVVKFGATAWAAKFAVFAFLQLGMIFSDLETRLLPDQFTKGGIVLGLIAAVLAPFDRSPFTYMLGVSNPRAQGFIEAAFAAAFLSGSVWLVGEVYSRVRGREGLGFGDVKMLAMIGAFQGFLPGLFTLFLGVISGSVLGLAYIYLTKKDASSYQLPFGSFLGAAALVSALTR